MTLAAETRGDGLPVVCLPWFGLDHTSMAAALEPALADRPGLRRLYLDLPGCGRSPAGPANSDAVVDAVSEFIDQRAGSDRFLLAGCSYGGYIAAALARRRPAQVAGLLLVCHGVKIIQADRDLPRAEAAVEAGDWLADVPPDLRTHLSQALGNRTRQVARRVAAVLTSSSPGDGEYLQRVRATGYRLPDEDSTAAYGGPTSIIAGRRDGVAGYADQLRALAGYPRASYAVLAGAGHYVPFEQPDAFAGLVLDWLTRSTDG
jgi:pimeloyl-ACP methyl ester carboxylesterase